MKLYYDLDVAAFVTTPGFNSLLDSISFKRGDTSQLQVAFSNGVNPVDLPVGAVLKFAVKEAGKYDGSTMVYVDTFTKVAGSTGLYEAYLNLNTVGINAAMKHNGNDSDDVKSISAMGELSWSAGGNVQSSPELAVIINNDVIKDNEGVPTAGAPAYPAAGAVQGAIGHVSNTANPHGVTKAQVGLTNVDNTSDADKPLSTAVVAALVLKLNAADTKIFTQAEKDKLATFEANYFKGVHTSLANLQSAHSTGKAGDYARVDAGTGTNVVGYIWDASDNSWVAGGGSGMMTGAEIKTALFAEADTNNFSDTLLSKLSGIAASATANDTDANLKNRANHTGTQPMSTISDAGTSATKNVPVGGVAATATQVVLGDDPRLLNPASPWLVALNASDPLFSNVPTEANKLLLRLDTKKPYVSENSIVVGEPTAATVVPHTTNIGVGGMFMANGTLLLTIDNSGSHLQIVAHPLSTPYNVDTRGTESYRQAIDTAFAGAGNEIATANAYTLCRLTDDSKVYISSGNSIWQFNLSTAGNLSTMTFGVKRSGISNYTIAYIVSPDGSKFLEVEGLGSNSKTYSMTGGDLSTLTLVSTFPNTKISGYTYLLYADNTGFNFIGVGDTVGTISKITLSTANDFNSTLTTGATLSVSNANAGGLFWDYQSGHLMVQGTYTDTNTVIYKSSSSALSWQPFSFT